MESKRQDLEDARNNMDEESTFNAVQLKDLVERIHLEFQSREQKP